jgi:hypothetical protein
MSKPYCEEKMEVEEEDEVEMMEVVEELEEGELVEDVTMEDLEVEAIKAAAEVERQGRKRTWIPDYHGCSSCGVNFPYRVGFEAHLSYCKSNAEEEEDEKMDQSSTPPLREILKPKSRRRGSRTANRKLDYPTSEYPSMGNFRLHPMYLRGILSKEEMDAYMVRHLEVLNEGGGGLLAV